MGFERPLAFKAGFSAFLGALLVGLFLASRDHVPLAPLPRSVLTVFAAGNLAMVLFVLAVMAATYARGVARIALRLRETNETLQTMAYYDPLTGLLNRRALGDRLASEVARARRHPPPPGFVVALADIDNFKEFNDRWGHDLGDRILVQMAQSLKAGLRAQDIPGRWGGEEFLLLLPETSAAAARPTLERLRAAVAQETLVHEGQTHSVTLTIGFSAWIPGEAPDQTIARADVQLLAGKRAGKNVVFGP